MLRTLCLVGLPALAFTFTMGAGMLDEDPISAAYQAHIASLKRKPGVAGFHFVVSPPFVVVGDEPEETVRRRARETVGWAVRMLKREYFTKDPAEIQTIWLFKDRDSYRNHAIGLFGGEPSTPYGYYLPAHNAVVANIATGGGTVVHEIVHAFMRPNFPQCPDWFDEGMGSLYEQCGERGGRIVGFTNWRLEGLQAAIRRDGVPEFSKLLSATRHKLNGSQGGLLYAQARYLLYYLQERGLLREFYQKFRGAVKADPTGTNTLKSVLKEPDLRTFQRHWEDSVMKLKFD